MTGEQPVRTTSTGDGLVMPKPHERKAGCPGCGARTATVALTKLVKTHEVYSCNQAEYTHLVERTWHRTCFISANAAGVAAGPQATPDRVLAETITDIGPDPGSHVFVHLPDTRAGTRVQVVAVPTDPTAVRVTEVRRPVPGARDMTGDAVPTDHEDPTNG